MPTTVSPRILIVDDEVEITEILADLLSEDYECSKADSAEDALARLQEGEFHLVISDITMPGMSGLDTIPHIKELSPDTVEEAREREHVATNEEILPDLASIVEEVAGVDAAEVTSEKSFVDDLDIDSLSMVEIAVQAEDKFGVKIPDDELAKLTTVQDAVDYISNHS